VGRSLPLKDRLHAQVRVERLIPSARSGFLAPAVFVTMSPFVVV
jgi:hypothetical protein